MMAVPEPTRNRRVQKAISELFGKSADSDCDIVILRETNYKCAEVALTKRKDADDNDTSAREVFGEPLPGHSIVLRNASRLFKAKLERWKDDRDTAHIDKRLRACPSGADADAAGVAAAAPAPFRPGRPQLLIPLAGEDEVPSALAAIQFAYTGRVQADSIRSVLEVRRQAAYLQIHDCAAACDSRLRKLLKADQATANGETGRTTPGEFPRSDGGGSPGRFPAALELFELESLWPESEEPSFQAVLQRATESLAAHFHSTVATLNTPALLEQLLALDVGLLVELLKNEKFATDSESSVLLLLATWMAKNYDTTCSCSRKALRDTLRLGQLSRPYATYILPALAADHERHPQEALGWLELGVMDAAFVGDIVTSDVYKKPELMVLIAKDEGDLNPTVFSAKARPSPAMTGSVERAEWYISQEDLKTAYDKLQPGQSAHVYGTFQCSGTKYYAAKGWHWAVSVQISHGQSEAGRPCMWCQLPAVLAPPASRLAGASTHRLLVPAVGDISVLRCPKENGDLYSLHYECRRGKAIRLGSCISDGVPFTLRPLRVMRGAGRQLPPGRPVQPSPRPAPAAVPQHGARAGPKTPSADGGATNALEAWSDYLKDGKITGFLVIQY